MAFAGWDPLGELLAIQKQLDHLSPSPAGWVPAVDLYENADRYVLTAEIPGLQREDIQIHFHDGSLTIAGSRREPSIACEQYHRIERGHGNFSRTFHLPMPVDADRISADLKDGVLTVDVPKIEDPPTRRIQVS
jgi:HSP20 family protein